MQLSMPSKSLVCMVFGLPSIAKVAHACSLSLHINPSPPSRPACAFTEIGDPTNSFCPAWQQSRLLRTLLPTRSRTTVHIDVPAPAMLCFLLPSVPTTFDLPAAGGFRLRAAMCSPMCPFCSFLAKSQTPCASFWHTACFDVCIILADCMLRCVDLSLLFCVRGMEKFPSALQVLFWVSSGSRPCLVWVSSDYMGLLLSSVCTRAHPLRCRVALSLVASPQTILHDILTPVCMPVGWMIIGKDTSFFATLSTPTPPSMSPSFGSAS